MASVTFNGQSFILDGRRLWIVGAAMQYARIPAPAWADRIADARQAGFNTIVTACPWMLHEPRRGRYAFDGDADVAGFIRLCDEASMRVVLRVGPYIGAGFDGGGIPAWLAEEPGVVLREDSERFLERISRYFRKLAGEVSDLQVTKSGPIALVQVEHGWACGNDRESNRYLRDIARVIRESGINVPLINANNLWPDSQDTIDTWLGSDDLLANLRQLRAVQPDAPRIVSGLVASDPPCWGAREGKPEPAMLLRRVAEALAAGAQPIVDPFHGGTNFGFMAGRLPGPAGGTMTTSAAASAPLGEAGARGETYLQVRRIASFGSQFAHLFSDLSPDYQPVTLDPEALGGGGKRGSGPGLTLAPLRGGGGRVVFVFGDGRTTTTTLLLDNGVRLPVDLGDQPVGWYVFETDLHGSGRLDFANLCPFAIVDRSIVVLHGPTRAVAYLSVNGTPLEASVPSGAQPLVLQHQGITFVICNRKQIDATYHDATTVYVGVSGLDREERPIPAPGWSRGWAVTRDAKVGPLPRSGAARTTTKGNRKSIRLAGWRAASAEAYATGKSPRFATLKGPETLGICGAPSGYGWYRVSLKVKTAGKRSVHAPRAGDRLHVYVDGALVDLVGDGPGATALPLEMKLPRGGQQITVLTDNFGRFADGNDLDRFPGISGHLYAIKKLRATKGKRIVADPIDPFLLRDFILGASAGQLSDDHQAEWTFTHARKTPVLVDVQGPRVHGTFVLNGDPVAYYAGETGARALPLLLDPAATEPFKRGKNVLRFAPDLHQDHSLAQIIEGTTLYECAETLTASTDWAFAKWEPPPTPRFSAVTQAEAARLRGHPCWWRCRFDRPDTDLPLWLDTTGLSKGQVLLNERNLGRYFTATRTGRAVGPQVRLAVPDAWLQESGANELLIFDEHGFSPLRSKLLLGATGDLD